MNISLRQLKGFLGVASTGSFTKTAQRLHQSQAALSSMIRELEKQLGSRLFNRSTRSVELTEAGSRFVPVATHIVEALEAAAVDLAEMDRQAGIRLNIGVTPIIAQSLIPLAINRFRERAPHVQLGVADCPPAELQRMVEAGQLDAAFGAFFSKVSGLDREPVFPSWLELVSASAHDRKLTGVVPWSRLDGERLITVHESSPIQQLADAQIAKLNIVPRSRTCVNQLETMIAFAEAGLGVGVIPSFARAACERYAVNVATLTPPIEYAYHRITRAGRLVSSSLQSFTALLGEIATAHQPAVEA